jgi:hypothetical protein
VDTARFSRGYDHKSRRDCTGWQTPDGGSGAAGYIEVQIRGDNSGIPAWFHVMGAVMASGDG